MKEILNLFFGRHRIRANFYHLVAIIFLISTGLWLVGVLSDKASFVLTCILFVLDYLAEMYDPHPDSPGPWFEAHFHRFLDNEEEGDKKVSRRLPELEELIKAGLALMILIDLFLIIWVLI